MLKAIGVNSSGIVAAYYQEANSLIALANYDKRSGTPSYKSVPVLLPRAAGGEKTSCFDREQRNPGILLIDRARGLPGQG